MLSARHTSVLSLGLLRPAADPAADPAAAVAALGALGPAAAARLLVRHKVGGLARAAAAGLVADAAVAGADAANLRALDHEIGTLREPFERGVGTAGELLGALRDRLPAAPVRLMKGLAAREWYPGDRRRDVGDADLWVPDAGTGWQVAGALRELGYDYETAELPWLKRDLDGTLFGQVKMLDPAGRSIAVDIHIGPYSVRYCGLVRFARSAAGEPWTPLSREDNLCAVVGNAAGDCFIDAKTVNDILACLAGPVDLAYVARTLEAAGLAPFLAAVVEVATSACTLTGAERSALATLRGCASPEPLGLAAEPDPRLRVRLVQAHTADAAWRLTGDPELADRIAAQARAAYEAAKRYRLVRVDRDRSFLPELNPWTCLRLAPQRVLRELFGQDMSLRFPVTARAPLAAGLELLTGPTGELVRFGGDVFVPTLDYVFPALLVFGEPAGRLAAAARGEGA
jgi:Uncharacterised nucleotidyltransferase